jgi:hypothetical protein
MSQIIETVFEVKHTDDNSQLLQVAGSGQKAAKAIDKKFKGKLDRKILRGFKIDGVFHAFTPPKIYGR